MENKTHRFPYEWTLKDAVFTKDKGTVFSCFACGGGSTMGYKLAGFDVIGCNEIDPKMMQCYVENHKPKYSFLEGIQTFKLRNDLPQELYSLDILDGSPPCSSFSMAGNREKDWGKEKKFREGQSKQILDTLFFDFIDLAEKLQPKVVIAENVKGLLIGAARKYVREILAAFDKAGYYVQYFLLDASKMGVPQKRERVFFVALRKDLAINFIYQKDMFTTVPKLDLVFDEKAITFGEIEENTDCCTISEHDSIVWNMRKQGDLCFKTTLIRERDKVSLWNTKYIYKESVCNTIASASGSKLILFHKDRYVNDSELIKISTFPSDYNFIGKGVKYVVGMSVPSIMTAQIATEIYSQWLQKM